MPKSTVEEIRARFDKDVERFTKLDEGNKAQVDSPLSLELITEAASVTNPNARSMLDVGCGGGNYTLKMLSRLHNLDVTLLDLSLPMLERARQRVSEMTTGSIRTLQGDIRQADIGVEAYDVITAGAVLHHLREVDEWRAVFAKFHAALRPGGTVWIFDLIQQTMPEVQQGMVKRYAEYLEGIDGPAYRDKVLGWVEMEDTPRPLMFQLDMLRAVGFRETDILHKNSCFATFGARK
jgi:tRNA (cmo5U34)-methyltransferase